MVLLVGAGLLLRSFVAMQQVDLGYRSEGVALAPVTFPAARYQEPARFASATNELLAKLRANPAVRTAELTDVPPLSGGDQDVDMLPVGVTLPANERASVWYRSVSPGYLSLMRMKLVEGRMFEDSDRSGAPNVVIINEELARKYWPGENAVGRMLTVGSAPDAPRLTVVGVVSSARHDGPNQPFKLEAFSSVAQFPVRGMTLVLEPARDAAALTGALRQALREVDPLLPTPSIQLMERRVGDAVEVPRLSATLVAMFAVVALLLAALGVYGVMAFTVAQRKREIGVRLAVGANPAGIRRLVLGRGLRLTAVGVGIGLVVALALGRVIESMLFGVSPFDVATMLTVPVILGLVSLLASWIPARRAMRLDPVRAMRDE
jgi:predicted permease